MMNTIKPLVLPLMLMCSFAIPDVATAQMKAATAQTNSRRAGDVRAAETAFAHTMEARDFEAFKTFISSEAVFYDGTTPTIGVDAISASWHRFFVGEQAPFSWAPDRVDVLESGTLAHSSGPVFDTDGEQIATFNSIWRLDTDGKWRVVFDKGCDSVTEAE